ncbi:autoinducer binding domain-containing protein [Sphingobium subterraneum]|uniref:LuxR family quorum-sensing system transcriptional regulator CciR n=1 Tax=Sphingobium subterraneum TaxID=627688 RepID=A0A841IVX8_9SPHN|nr:LuxR family quorum-sensing system transcriptional regulator CciR [Sphingobium subterraneum]
MRKFDFNYFVAEFAKATNMESLHATLEQATHDLGFRYFAMGHHVDLAIPPEGIVRLTNYHESWIGQIVEEGFFADDPIHAASTKSLVGFLWHDVGSLIELSDRQKQILETAAKFGLATGCTIPAHIPGEFLGTCSFGAPSLDQLRDDSLPAAYIVGGFAFEAARRIVRRKSRYGTEPTPTFTSRQHEALIWMGRGKADSEIGTLMGIATSTAHEHVEHVRRAYGNAQRVHLIVRALFDGVVTFTDLLRR